MTDRLKRAQELLTEFNHQLAEKRSIYDGFHLGGDHQNKLREDFLAKELAYSWIYAAVDHYLIEPLHPKSKESPKAYLKSANPFYEDWLSRELDIQIFKEYIIPPPSQKATLETYLDQLRTIIVEQQEHRTIWWKSLRSFTDFLRRKIPFDQHGWLKTLFPDDMGLVCEEATEEDPPSTFIIRKVPLTAHAIDIITASKILETLADDALNGRLDARLTAAETLGLCWICLASSRLKIPTELSMLFESNTLVQEQSMYYLELQTFLGDIPAEISCMQYQYLNALSGNQSFFESNLRSLRRSFDRAVSKACLSNSLGKITFLSFMSPPHLAVGRRCQKSPVVSL